MKISSFNIFIVLFVVFVSVSRAEEIVTTDKPAEYFFYRCAGCHTIGGGKLTGPDLITSTKWSDADLKSAIKKMEKNVGPMTDVDISLLIAFLKDLTVADRIANQKRIIEAQFRAELPPASYETGEKLFRGEKTLVNGGPACISCHRFVNEGGSLGFDLSLIKDRVSGVALQSAIENSSYKIMRPIYDKHKITKEEALHLSEYLSHPEKNDQRSEMNLDEVLSLALAGVCGFFILIWILNQKRKGRTRDNLVQKSKKGNLP